MVSVVSELAFYDCLACSLRFLASFHKELQAAVWRASDVCLEIVGPLVHVFAKLGVNAIESFCRTEAVFSGNCSHGKLHAHYRN